ncbi:NB-ARC domains-containing protein [Tanacetum coccineum]
MVSLGEKEEEDGSCNQLTSLRILELLSCQNLERCKLPNNIQELSIYYCDSIASVSFPIVGGHKLKSLEINGCEKLLEKELLNPSMPKLMLEVVWISSWKNLKSINELTCFIHMKKLENMIRDCSSIESFPAADLPNLTSLTHLMIRDCENMEVDSFGLWPPKLDFLEIGGLKKPISKLGPQNFPPSLVVLLLFGRSAEEDDVSSGISFNGTPTPHLPPTITKLESVSMGLQHLTSLQHLRIVDCRKIEDLPEKLLPSLLTLAIWPLNLKEKMRVFDIASKLITYYGHIRNGFRNFNEFLQPNLVYNKHNMPSSMPLSRISEKAYTFVSVNMNLPINFFDATAICLGI